MTRGERCGRYMLSGLMDKLFWRPVRGGRWHCLKSVQGGGYQSLCGGVTRARSGGQAICRPPSILRCALCDGAEMKRRGWEEGGPDSENWREGRTR